jgi:excisionase family DNA binding protein
MSHVASEGYSPNRPAPLLTISETAAVLGVVRSTVFRLLAEGQLPAVRVGHRRRIRQEDLAAYLEGRREPLEVP